MLPTTKRKPGKISVSEVMEFQRRYGLVMDGKVGRQSMGQVLELEQAYHDAVQAYKDLKTSPADRPLDWWGFFAGIVAASIAGFLGFWHWLAALFH